MSLKTGCFAEQTLTNRATQKIEDSLDVAQIAFIVVVSQQRFHSQCLYITGKQTLLADAQQLECRSDGILGTDCGWVSPFF